MGPYISAAQENIQGIVEALVVAEKCNVRFGLVAYRDHPPQDTSFVTRTFDFTSSPSLMRRNVDTLTVSRVKRCWVRSGLSAWVPAEYGFLSEKVLYLSFSDYNLPLCLLFIFGSAAYMAGRSRSSVGRTRLYSKCIHFAANLHCASAGVGGISAHKTTLPRTPPLSGGVFDSHPCLSRKSESWPFPKTIQKNVTWT